MSYESAAGILTESLNLASPPVALAFATTEAAQAISVQMEAAPSACSFWRTAESGVFYASAEAHFSCPVGAMVLGFDLPKTVSDELMNLVQTMGGCGYLAAEEAGHIPTYKGKAQGVIYGPLSQFPVDPYAVLCWLTPVQAMIWNEASGGAVWTKERSASIFGRPACAALPMAVESKRPVISLGCMGMRTFTEIASDRLLAVLPGSEISEFAAALLSMRNTNDSMQSFYGSRKQSFEENARAGK